MAEKKKRQGLGKVRWTVILLMLLVMAIGAFMVVYPYMDVWEAEREVQQEIQVWREQMLVPPTYAPTTETEPDFTEAEPGTETEPTEITSTPLDDLKRTMQTFNRDIYMEGQAELADAFDYETQIFDLTQYGMDTEVFGVISIPKINLELPLYLGASEEHLSKGFGQMSKTSFPVGGNNTNCVVACHRGWRGMAYMRDCELLGEGDVLYLENPWETLEYRLVEVVVVNPWETESIYIQAGRDLLTIFTCHPYGVGTHRYVMIFERYHPEEAATQPPEQEESSEPTEAAGSELVVGWGNTITVTTTEDVDFVSSQMEIFWRFYFPWLCIGLIAVLLILTLLILAISGIARAIKRQHRDREE